MQPARKHSKKKDAILQVLCSTKIHPTAQWVYEQARQEIPELSLGTVYRNLSQFQEDGMVMVVDVVNGEQRFDGTVEPHPHFVCERCGSVIDLSACVMADRDGLGKSIEDAGHRVDYRKTVYHGICKSCLGH